MEKQYEMNGEYRSLSEWAEIYRVAKSTLSARIHKGQAFDDALLDLVQKKSEKRKILTVKDRREQRPSQIFVTRKPSEILEEKKSKSSGLKFHRGGACAGYYDY